MSSRTIGWIGLFVSLAALFVSVGLMGTRVNGYYNSIEHTQWMFDPLDSRSFTYAGRNVAIIDENHPDGRVTVIVRYGDAEQRIEATIPPLQATLPGLVRHQDWLKVVRFAEHGRRSLRDAVKMIDSGEITDRLVIAVRRPPPGMNPETLGRLAKTEWKFDLYEFKPTGGFQVYRLGWPESKRQWEARVREARAAGKPTPEPDSERLQEGTWQYYAALLVMPTKPSPRFTSDAVMAMGWTLPSAGFSALAVVASIITITSARRRVLPPVFSAAAASGR